MKRFLTAMLCIAVFLSAGRPAWAKTMTVSSADLYRQAELQMSQGDFASAASVFEILGDYADAPQMAAYARAFAVAEGFGQFEDAITAFKELGAFKDSEQMIAYYQGRQYQYKAETYIREGFEGKGDAFLTGIEESYRKARQIYSRQPLFRDSMTRMAECKMQEKRIQKELRARSTERQKAEEEARRKEETAKAEEEPETAEPEDPASKETPDPKTEVPEVVTVVIETVNMK